jgi:hypothetical protein
MGEWSYSSTILDLYTSWKWRSVLRPGRFILGQTASGAFWIGGCVDLRARLDAAEKRKISWLCRDSNPEHTVCIPSLYRLNYHSSFKYQVRGTKLNFEFCTYGLLHTYKIVTAVKLYLVRILAVKKTSAPAYSWKVLWFFIHVAWWMRGSEAIIPCRKSWKISPGYNNASTTACFPTCNGYEGRTDINLIHSSLRTF